MQILICLLVLFSFFKCALWIVKSLRFKTLALVAILLFHAGAWYGAHALSDSWLNTSTKHSIAKF